MIKRILTFIVLCTCLGGASWFFLRDNPARTAQGLQRRIEQLLYSDDPQGWFAVTTEDDRGNVDIRKLSGRVTIARNAADDLLALVPHSTYALSLRANVEVVGGNLREAVAWCERIAGQARPPASILITLGKLYGRLGKLEVARRAFVSAVDELPLQAHLGIGKLKLETLEYDVAYSHLATAREIAARQDKPKELRMALEGLTEALGALVSSAALKIRRLEQDSVDGSRTSIESRLLRWGEERSKVLDEAIALWQEVDPKSKTEYVTAQMRIADLIGKKDSADGTEAAVRSLMDAVSSDDDQTFVPIYLTLGALKLGMADTRDLPPEKKEQFVEEAETQFLKALSFKAAGNAREIARRTGWKLSLSGELSEEEFQAKVMLSMCLSLLKFSESWRMLADSHPSGKKDPLGVFARIESVLASPNVRESVGLELRGVRALAFIDAEDRQSFQRELDEILSRSEEKFDFILELATRCVQLAPEHLPALTNAMDIEGLLEKADEEAGRTKNLRRLASMVRILQEARLHELRDLRGQDDLFEKRRQELLSENNELKDKIHALLIQISAKAEDASYFLHASRMMGSLFGHQEASDVLAQGLEKFPNNLDLRYSLAVKHFSSARSVSESSSSSGSQGVVDRSERWTYLKSAVKGLLWVFKEDPYRSNALQMLLTIGAEFKHSPDAPPLDLHDLVAEIFSQCSGGDLKAVTRILEAFVLGNIEDVVDAPPGPDVASCARPFLNFVVGASHLDYSARLLNEFGQANPGLAKDFNPVEFRGRVDALRESARAEFVRGNQVDSSYLPVHVELLRMELRGFAGKEVPASYLSRIRDLVAQAPDHSQSQYLLVLALRAKSRNQVQEGADGKKILASILEERVALRKAIRANPHFTEAHLFLASNYVFDFGTSGDLSGTQQPDYGKAIAILSNAPRTPDVLRRLAGYLRSSGDLETAFNVYEALFRVQPTEAHANAVIRNFVDRGDLAGARHWLSQLDSSVQAGDVEILRNSLAALVAAAEANLPATPNYEKERLADEQIQRYREVLERARAQGLRPPAFVVNNLAYVLAETGREENVKEALSLMEPLIEKIRASEVLVYRGTNEDLEETFAWVLYRSGDLEKARSIYADLCERKAEPQFLVNYAQVLYDLRKYRQARDKIEVVLAARNSDEIRGKAKRLQGDIESALQRSFDKKLDFER